MATLPVDKIIIVNVKRQKGILSLEDFGELCVFTENTVLSIGEVKQYDDVTAFDADFSAPSSMKDYGDVFFAQSPVPTKLLVARVDTTGSTYEADIETAKASHKFYAVGIDKPDLIAATIDAIALKVQALELLCVLVRDKTDITAVGATLAAANSDRMALIESDDVTITTNRPDAAWLGTGLTKQAGAFNWANNTLVGTLTTSETTTQVETWLTADLNVYVRVGNIDMTLEGTTLGTTKTYIDQVQAQDWLKINIQTDILNLLNSEDKIPFTDGGVKILEAAILKVLRTGQTLNILDQTTRVTASAPSVTTLTPAQRTSRVAPTITATGRLSGAINKIIINVNLEI